MSATDLDSLSSPPSAPDPDADLDRVLHQELARLPDAARTPVLLCYVEGLTYTEAARRLGCPVGTLAGRITRARDQLARRLARRGLTPALLASTAPVVCPSFAGATTAAAVAFTGGGHPAIRPSVAELASREVQGMFMRKLLWPAGLLAVCAAAAVAVGRSGQPPDPAGAGVALAPQQAEPPAKRPALKGSARSRALAEVERLGGVFGVRPDGPKEFLTTAAKHGYDPRVYYTPLSVGIGPHCQGFDPDRPLRDADLEGLADHLTLFTLLEHLDLQSNPGVTDKGVAALPPLPRLKSLALDLTGVTDRVIDVLGKYPALEALGVVETSVTEEGAARIRREFPKCVVTRTR